MRALAVAGHLLLRVYSMVDFAQYFTLGNFGLKQIFPRLEPVLLGLNIGEPAVFADALEPFGVVDMIELEPLQDVFVGPRFNMLIEVTSIVPLAATTLNDLQASLVNVGPTFGM